MKNWISILAVMVVVFAIMIAFGGDTPKYGEGNLNKEFVLDYVESVQKMPTNEVIKESNYADVNKDKVVGISDLMFIRDVLVEEPKEVPKRVDVNGDCLVNWDDLWYYASWMFSGGDAPVKWCSQ